MKWLLLFTKRNFKRTSFLLILLLIPAITLILSAMTDEGGTVMRIGYCCTGDADDSTRDVFKSLKDDDGIIGFTCYEAVRDGENALHLGKIDTLWIFPENLSEEINKYFSDSEVPVIRILRRESSTASRLADEKLFCVIYPYVSYSIYQNHMTDINDLSNDELQWYYDYMGLNSDIIEFATVDGNIPRDEKSSLLTSPIRGMLSVIIMLSGLASAMYTLSDIRRGLYSTLAPKKRFLLQVSASLSAILPTTAASMLALGLTGMLDGISDIIIVLPFITACTSLSIFSVGIFHSPEALGAVIPIFTVTSLVLSPIFIDLEVGWLQGLLPTYHYLYSSVAPSHIAALFMYSIITGAFGAALIKNKC